MSIVSFLKPTPKRIILTAVVFAVILCVSYLYFGLFPYLFKSESMSMSPAINRYDLLFAKKVNFNDLKVGDIVMYSVQQGQPMIANRIVNIDHDKSLFSTKGDNNNGQLAFEKNVSSDKIYGQIVGSLPLVGVLDDSFVLIMFLIAIYLVSCIIIRGPRPNSATSQGKRTTESSEP